MSLRVRATVSVAVAGRADDMTARTGITTSGTDWPNSGGRRQVGAGRAFIRRDPIGAQRADASRKLPGRRTHLPPCGRTGAQCDWQAAALRRGGGTRLVLRGLRCVVSAARLTAAAGASTGRFFRGRLSAHRGLCCGLADDETDPTGRAVDEDALAFRVLCRHLQKCVAGHAGVAL